MPAAILNNSPAKWLILPLPADAMLTLPGLTLACAMNSATVAAGTDGCTIIRLGVVMIPATPRRVAGIIATPSLMIAHPSVPAATVAEFIAHAKASPGRVNMASAGNGSISHLAGELFKMAAGIDLLHVPYRGASPALTDLLGGQVQVMFASAPSSIEYVRAGTVRGLAVTTAKRSPALPDLPTVGEFVPGYEVSAWYGVVAPKDTPVGIIETLNKEINAAFADSKTKARLVEVGGTVLPASPAEFGKLIADDTEKWAKVIKFAGIKAI